ncbi:MAG: hypothetical protein JRI68_11165 [Deltaproteobacteria bacterium]|nr:hypothetical protein [Deltaproteobacteria bacterium]
MEVLAYYTFGLLVAIVATIVARYRRRRQIDHDLDAWARALGLVRVGNDLFGQREGMPVGARLALDAPKGQWARWTVHARLQPPLDLGLSIHTGRHEVEDVTKGASLVVTGDAEFDKRFVVRGDEPERVRALLDPPLRQRLVRQLHPGALFMVTDQGVAMQVPRPHANLEWFTRALNTLTGIASGVNRARSNVPVAAVLQRHRTSWAAFASSQMLHGISAPLCMWGRLRGATVFAYSVRLGPGDLCLEIWLRFQEPLGLGVLLQPKRTVDRVKELFGADDHELGDPVFDETFLLRLSDVEATEALLDEPLRKRLLAIHSTVGPLSLTDDGLLVRLPTVPLDPAVVPNKVGHLLELAREIAERRGGQRDGGPYR